MMPGRKTMSCLNVMMGDAVSVVTVIVITKSGSTLVPCLTTGETVDIAVAVVVSDCCPTMISRRCSPALMGVILAQRGRAVMPAHEGRRVLQLMSVVIRQVLTGHVDLSAMSDSARTPQGRAALIKVMLRGCDAMLLRCTEVVCRSTTEAAMMNRTTTESAAVVHSATEAAAVMHAAAEATAVVHAATHVTATHVAPAHMATTTAMSMKCWQI